MDQAKLYIQMFSIHGLLRAEEMELGRDADTGGQIRYVVELARTLSQHDEVERVDLFTRLVADKSVSEDYARSVEEVNDRFRIVRIQCGGKKYLRKELLWPYLDEYVDRVIRFTRTGGRMPDIVHGHYADAGYVAMQLSHLLGTPFVFTGHSLGRSKQARLLAQGMREQEINKKYRIDHRIAVEEEVIKKADLIFASTHQEVKEQYGAYRSKGVPVFRVNPPGFEVNRFYPFSHDTLFEQSRDEREVYAHATVLEELHRFFLNPDKPLILALCRPDKRKNIGGLVRAYGRDLELQAMANLAIFAGIRKDICTMEENERDVLTEMLLLMDKYDLYGKMAIPKKHNVEYEVPALYRITAAKKGVFVNVALIEPFGLTLIEASACGVPIVATNDGGPQDIIRNCKNGLLVDPENPALIGQSLKKIIADGGQWRQFSQDGIEQVRLHYTWDAHVDRSVSELVRLARGAGHSDLTPARPRDAIGRRLARLDHFIITDIDNTLIGRDNSRLAELSDVLHKKRDTVGFGVATGRTVEDAVVYLEQNGLPEPDVIISSVGTELYYGPATLYGKGWETHISRHWDRERIRALLDGLDFLEYQEKDCQRPFKVSYYMDPGKDRLAVIHDLLLKNRCRYNLIYSHEQFLDILPYRASKGKAVRYLSYKWEIPLENMLVCGDSGNDEEMLRGETLAVVVANYSPELDRLSGAHNVYFADRECAGGIMEAMEHYRFPGNVREVSP